jgi:hypothetical protein
MNKTSKRVTRNNKTRKNKMRFRPFSVSAESNVAFSIKNRRKCGGSNLKRSSKKNSNHGGDPKKLFAKSFMPMLREIGHGLSQHHLKKYITNPDAYKTQYRPTTPHQITYTPRSFRSPSPFYVIKRKSPTKSSRNV